MAPLAIDKRRFRAIQARKAGVAAAATANFYHTITAGYDNTLSRLATPLDENNAKGTSFMDLPAELRVQIYELALPESKPVWVRKPFGIIETPHLLMTSKLIRVEALPIYYQLNTFHIGLYMDDFPSAAKWISKRVEEMGGKPLRNIHFMISCPRWETLPKIMPLLELVWNRSLIPDIARVIERNPVSRDVHHDGPFFIATKYPAGYLQAGLEAATLHAEKIGVEGGSMVEVVDAAASALGYYSSLANDRRFVMGLRKYNLYQKLVAWRASYYEEGERYSLPEEVA